MKDKLGQDITIGCYIAYPYGRGSSAAGLRIGKVFDLKTTYKKCHWKDELEPNHRITIRGVDDIHRSFYEPRLLSKRSTLLFPERVVVLHPDTVPQSFKELLEQG
jgi:hypothetical protein